MGWPYHFLDLTEAEKLARRQAIDRYATYAHVSALIPVAVFVVLRLGSRLVRTATSSRGAYAAVSGSPRQKQHRVSLAGSWSRSIRKAVWWLGDDVVVFGQRRGQWGQMIAGIAWTLWLLFLSVAGTGSDYLHLTKRLGFVAISQFPIQYLMALKNLNPLAFAFNSSHEQVNRWHRVLGLIIYLLLTLHAFLYLNFYIQQGILSNKLVQLVPLLGIAAFAGMSVLNITALSFVRQYSYRVFFITHIIVAFALPLIVFFHARSSSFYVAEALVVFIVDLAKRKYDSITAKTSLEAIPGTDLIKIVASVPAQTASRFRETPGSHVYLNVPTTSRPSQNPLATAHLVFEFVFSPFTVASINEEAGELTLVARCHDGPMTRAFANFANASSADTKVPLTLEGPYGCATRFPSLASSEFDRVLLVAGGVGATFILPIYRSILHENPAARVQMVWAVRGAGDATWPMPGKGETSILEDNNVQLFLTGNLLEDGSSNAGPSDASEGVEMDTISKARTDGKSASTHNRNRPNLQKIVDDVFKQGVEDRVAVLVCGPEEMARELRSYVGVWVKKGRQVWWHNESFAW
ncbi:Uu.00g139150.m01.CDS01 [Anthostomella pinea]|uniref:Uu.00g139150.m01.CDS01 n=1 Tax=Anthostomella pinea TaxID=933095 RepID=A0AAI8VQH4_9PEZI|nr:Uu.00g139150.m01.CDS01 [Anthostomella pinea]